MQCTPEGCLGQGSRQPAVSSEAGPGSVLLAGYVLVGSVLVGSVLVGSVLVGSVLAGSVLVGSVLDHAELLATEPGLCEHDEAW
jgi:hypothetical protein